MAVLQQLFIRKYVAEGLRDPGEAGRRGVLVGVQGAPPGGRADVRAEAGEDGRALGEGEGECAERDPDPGVDPPPQRDRVQAGVHGRGQQVALVDSIVMEFASNGDLAAKIAKHLQQGTQVPEQAIWNIFVHLVRGLKQLHDLHIFHRDIKTANVFLSDNDGAKLGDMNVSKVSEEGLCLTQTGTPYYASPEVWKDQPYDEKSDIWSLGCVLYELICLKVPFKAEDMEGLYKKVTRGIYPRLPPEYSQELGAVIRALLQVNPDQRPSCEKILRMPAVQRHAVGEGGEEVRCELLRTIKAETFQTISENLPKANYQPQPKKKAKEAKGLRSVVEAEEGRSEPLESICEIESLPVLERDKKIYPMENSDRVMSKDKLNVHLVNRDRKKSEMGYSRSGLEPTALTSKLDEIKELKLPKVQNRYNRNKEKGPKHNQNSLRCYKIFEC